MIYPNVPDIGFVATWLLIYWLSGLREDFYRLSLVFAVVFGFDGVLYASVAWPLMSIVRLLFDVTEFRQLDNTAKSGGVK